MEEARSLMYRGIKGCMIPTCSWLLGDLDPNGDPNSASLYRFQPSSNKHIYQKLHFIIASKIMWQHSLSPEIGVHGTPYDNFSRSGSGGVNLSKLAVGLDLSEPASSKWSSTTSVKFEVPSPSPHLEQYCSSTYKSNIGAACASYERWRTFDNERRGWIPCNLQVILPWLELSWVLFPWSLA